MTMVSLLLLVGAVLVAPSTADITGTNPPEGSCLCADGSGINVRRSACGTIIGQVNSGQCFLYKGSKSRCTLDGKRHEFFAIRFRSGSGWIAGSLLIWGLSSDCEILSRRKRAASCPSTVSRADWGARQATSVKRLTVPVPKVFIHHTASPSCKKQSECETLVQSFQNDHMDKNGWSDIGYNFLVGEDGNVYEGRGWDTVGAHTINYNSVSIGISVIGNFMESAPNNAALDAVKRLIACGVSKGKVSSSYKLHGHRDGYCTECPGDAFYKVIKGWPKYGGKLSGSC